ncbi:hypothetical protein ACB092_11G016800 [Castanea dentata]
MVGWLVMGISPTQKNPTRILHQNLPYKYRIFSSKKFIIPVCIMPTAKLSLKVELVTTQILLFRFFLY